MPVREYPYPRAAAGITAGAAALVLMLGAALAPDAIAAPSADSDYSVDDRGYVDSSARCDEHQALMAYGRTSRALVAICVDANGQLEYRGVRLSDSAALAMPATRGADGSIVATNDGVTYAVSPTMFIVSEGDTVIYRDSWTEFGQPRFSGGTSTPATTSTAPTTPNTSTTATTPGAAPTTTVSTTTVSTTTVTPTATTPSTTSTRSAG